MTYLNITNFEGAAEKHYAGLKDSIISKLNNSNLKKEMKTFLSDNLENILKGDPLKLIDVERKFNEKAAALHLTTGARKKKAFFKEIKRAFNYKIFTAKSKQYDAYDLAENLDVRVCVYCNRMYTLTVQSGGKITRPEFDHFFSQGKYPLLALSFFNLIPSCKICNSTLKHTKEFSIGENLHPYLDDCWQSFRYSFTPSGTQSLLGAQKQLKVVLKTDSCTDPKLKIKIENTFEIFKISEIYSGHAEEISDILKIRNVMTDNYLEILRTHTYRHLQLTEDELYRLAFGTYREEVNFHKRPFSKLKKDILKELGMI
ncbi:hypothetical protein [Haliscomenobacter sp.]|uniref:hypothetical protein n=1 Tax=Haliscomenobacter sp. TaxID=2717303 RepID=UPI003594858D